MQTPLSGGRQPPEPTLGGLTPTAREPETTASDAPEATAEPWGNRRIAVAGVSAFWSIGVLGMLLRWVGGAWFLRRLRHGAGEVSGPAAEVFFSCRLELGVESRVRLAIHPRVRSPVLLGLFRPIILVPLDWPSLPEAMQRAGLLHELAHVRRRDHWLTPLLQLVRAGFFFHPFVRWLLARLERERELLCDEMVLHRGIDRRDYARMLLDFARHSGRFALPRLAGPYLPIGRRQTIKARIHHLLEENMERSMGPLPARWAVVLGTCFLAAMLGVASYRVLAEEPEKPAAPSEPGKSRTATEEEAKTKGTAEKQRDARTRREALRYGGKNFNQWRVELETELKPEIRVDGMYALAAFGANGYGPEATRSILDMMRGYNLYRLFDKDQQVIDAAMNALDKIGDSAVPALLAGLQDDSRNVRRVAVQYFIRQGVGADAVPGLLKAAKDEDAKLRQAALDVLASVQSKPDSCVPTLLELLDDDDVHVRLRALRNLQTMKSDEKNVLPALVRAIDDPHEAVQDRAIQIIGTYGPRAKSAVPTLIEKLKTGKHLLHALDTLARIGPGARAAIPALKKLRGKKGIGELQTGRAIPIGEGELIQRMETYGDRIEATLKKIDEK
jgi:beta-lactamase regulating signal transducer with metallopeptidase domain